MISGDGAVSVVTNLSDLKLFGVVFALPSSSEPAPSEKLSRYISFLLFNIRELSKSGSMTLLSGAKPHDREGVHRHP